MNLSNHGTCQDKLFTLCTQQFPCSRGSLKAKVFIFLIIFYKLPHFRTLSRNRAPKLSKEAEELSCKPLTGLCYRRKRAEPEKIDADRHWKFTDNNLSKCQSFHSQHLLQLNKCKENDVFCHNILLIFWFIRVLVPWFLIHFRISLLSINLDKIHCLKLLNLTKNFPYFVLLFIWLWDPNLKKILDWHTSHLIFPWKNSTNQWDFNHLTGVPPWYYPKKASQCWFRTLQGALQNTHTYLDYKLLKVIIYIH